MGRAPENIFEFGYIIIVPPSRALAVAGSTHGRLYVESKRQRAFQRETEPKETGFGSSVGRGGICWLLIFWLAAITGKKQTKGLSPVCSDVWKNVIVAG